MRQFILDYLLTGKFVAAHYGFVIALAFASYAIGYRLTRRISYESFLEEFSVCTGLGLGTIAFLIFLLGLAGLLYRSVVLLVLAVCVAISYSSLPRLLKKIRFTLSQLRARIIVVGAAVFLATVPLLALPLYPPTTFDSTMYFLASAKIYAHSHQLVFTPYLRLPLLTQLNEMLFVLALLFSDDITAQVIQMMMLFIVVVAVFAFSRRFFSKETAWWSTAILLASPLVLFAGVFAYVDVSLLLFGTLAAYAFWNWLGSRERVWLLLCGAFCGFAAGAKYPGLFFPLFFALIALYIAIRERRYATPLPIVAPTLALAGPWYARNFYYTRNPVFPFFPSVFGYTFWSAADVEKLTAVMRGIGFGRGPRALVLLPWHLAFRQDVFYGAFTLTKILFFALPLVVVFMIKDARVRRLVGFAFAFTLFWFFSDQELRYLLPAVPMLAVAAAASLQMLLGAVPFVRNWSRQWLVTVVVGMALVSAGYIFVRDFWRMSGAIPVTQQQRDNYLTIVLPSYPAYKFLNELRGDKYKVYALHGVNMAYYADGTFMGDVFGPARYDLIVKNLEDGRALYAELRRLGTDFFLIDSALGKVNVPQDEFFNKHFKLIFSHPTVSVYELSETEFSTGEGAR